jgi:hypothetical protein
VKQNQGLLPAMLAVAMLTVNRDDLKETEIVSLPKPEKTTSP